MNELKVFNNEKFGEMRATIINGKPHVCASDVAKALGYKNERDAVRTKCKGVVKHDILTNGGNQKVNFIPESDIYRLIFGSKLPSAVEFQDWVFEEVLPTINKTGGYISNDDMFINTYLPFADETTKILFKSTLETVRKQNELIESQQQTIKKQEEDILHKEDVIIDLTKDITIAEKRQRITQIIRYNANGKFKERYNLLYEEFNKKFHCDIQRRLLNGKENGTIKKSANLMDYICSDKYMNMTNELYDLCIKIFEADFIELLNEWKDAINK